MKQIYVLRHADKDKETNLLTPEGRRRATLLKNKLGPFDLVITSDRDRTRETAFLLTGQQPILDARSGFFYFSQDQEKEIRLLTKAHPQSYAGVIFGSTKYKDLALALGNNLLELIRETLTKLPDTGKALIISQDGVMVAAEKLLTRKTFEKLDKYFLPLQGFLVDENLHLTELR